MEIFEAVINNDLCMIKLIIANTGANIECIDEDGRTPLHWAASLGHLEIVHELVAYGANLEARDLYGCTPIFFAVDNGEFEIVEFLIHKNPDLVNAVNDSGFTPASFNMEGDNYNLKMLQLLKSHGAEVELDSEGTDATEATEETE